MGSYKRDYKSPEMGFAGEGFGVAQLGTCSKLLQSCSEVAVVHHGSLQRGSKFALNYSLIPQCSNVCQNPIPKWAPAVVCNGGVRVVEHRV